MKPINKLERWAKIYEKWQESPKKAIAIALESGISHQKMREKINQLERYGLSGSFHPTGAVHASNCRKYGISRPELIEELLKC